MSTVAPDAATGGWRPAPIRISPGGLLMAWLVAALALLAVAAILPGVHVDGLPGAIVAAGVIGILNLVLPAFVAALRVPFTVGVVFVLVLAADAGILVLASEVGPEAIGVDGWGWACLAALATAAVSIVLEVLLGTNDDQGFNLYVARRVARRTGPVTATDVYRITFPGNAQHCVTTVTPLYVHATAELNHQVSTAEVRFLDAGTGTAIHPWFNVTVVCPLP